VKVRFYTFQEIKEKDLRKEVEGWLLREFNQYLIQRFSISDERSLKNRLISLNLQNSNVSVLGMVSRTPRPELKVSNFDDIKQTLGL
jgi:hypothetical protein